MSTANSRLPLALAFRPWAIHKPALLGILEQVQLRAAAIARMTATDIENAVLASASAPLGRMVGSVAVIPVTGCITQKSDFYSWWFCGTSIERLTAAFRQYVNDPAVSTIVFDVDSPGGEVYGVPEFFEEVFASRGIKKLVAVSNPFMASAAYWVSAACDEIHLIPSGQAGSVGCYTVHEDMSKLLERIGVDITFIQYGEHKTEGNAYEPLTESAASELQAGVDYYGTLFDKAVAKGRNVSMADVKGHFGQGRVLRAPDAKRVGMVDKIATLDEVLAKFAPKRARALALSTTETPEPMATEFADPVIESKKRADSVEPNEDGSCPDGYEKGDDGQCHLPSEDAQAAAVQQEQADQDAINVTLALTE